MAMVLSPLLLRRARPDLATAVPILDGHQPSSLTLPILLLAPPLAVVLKIPRYVVALSL